jgi:hypothetical protein
VDGYQLTVCHALHDEVQYYRQHWWKCDRCDLLCYLSYKPSKHHAASPYLSAPDSHQVFVSKQRTFHYGAQLWANFHVAVEGCMESCRCEHVVKRAMNRKPQPADCLTRQGDACRDDRCRYHTHVRTCGGTFVKIKEPEPKTKHSKGKPAAASAHKQAAAGGTSGSGDSSSAHGIAAAFKRARIKSEVSEAAQLGSCGHNASACEHSQPDDQRQAQGVIAQHGPRRKRERSPSGQDADTDSAVQRLRHMELSSTADPLQSRHSASAARSIAAGLCQPPDAAALDLTAAASPPQGSGGGGRNSGRRHAAVDLRSDSSDLDAVAVPADPSGSGPCDCTGVVGADGSEADVARRADAEREARRKLCADAAMRRIVAARAAAQQHGTGSPTEPPEGM